MMNLIIDQGNTRIKYAIFRNSNIVKTFVSDDFTAKMLDTISKKFDIKNCIVSSTRQNKAHFNFLNTRYKHFIFLDHTVNLPVKNTYKTPDTLGKDRLAGSIGAHALNKGKYSMVIDAGTALTADYISESGDYLGGTISPGLEMRLKALHTFTSKLPLVEAKFTDYNIGKNTAEAIQQGVYKGMLSEINALCENFYSEHPQGKVFLTGGDSDFFDKKLKNTIFVNSNLVLLGLNTILEHNAN